MRSRLVLGRAASPGNSGAPFGSVATPMAVRRSARAAIVLPASPGVPEVVRASGMKRLKPGAPGGSENLFGLFRSARSCAGTLALAVSLRDGNEDRLDERLA